jgi:hypothetical protein
VAKKVVFGAAPQTGRSFICLLLGAKQFCPSGVHST